MKVVDLIKISTPLLKTLSENEVGKDDWRYAGLYDEFESMRSLGVKYAEAVRMLSEDYSLGRATVERIIARLSKPVLV